MSLLSRIASQFIKYFASGDKKLSFRVLYTSPQPDLTEKVKELEARLAELTKWAEDAKTALDSCGEYIEDTYREQWFDSEKIREGKENFTLKD
jgi:hypothetical protein